MALNAFSVHWLHRLYRKGVFQNQGKLLELGPQDLHDSVSPAVLERVAGSLERGSDRALLDSIAQQRTAAQLYRLFGVTDYRSLDYFDRRADYSLDLNHAINMSEKFGLITSFGTAEHCFNVSAVFETIHNLLPVGGISLHILPAFGDIDHGFYNIHPLLYLKVAQANGYHIVDLTYADNVYVRAMGIKDAPAQATDFESFPLQHADMQELVPFKRKVNSNFVRNMGSAETARYIAGDNSLVFDHCYVALQKTREGAFVTPSQY